MIGVKAFKYVSTRSVNVNRIIDGNMNWKRSISSENRLKYVKSGDCGYCGIKYQIDQLDYKMTLKMIIEMDRHL